MTSSMPRNRTMVGIVFLTFFVMSLLTNILGPLVPDIISSFRVSLTAAALLPFAFFIAYGVMSIPAGFLVEQFGEKSVMIVAFLAGTLGSLSFAFHPTYQVAVVSLFVMGSGMATLQTAINPLLRVAGGEEHFAFNSAFAQLIFGLASFLNPYLYSYLVLNLGSGANQSNPLLAILSRLTPRELPWASMYWIFAVFTVLMIGVLLLTRFPVVERTEDEHAGSLAMYGKLFRKPMVWAFFLCVFAYVGSEQGTADWISKFLSQYHGYDPHTTGATAVAWFWGLLTAGCFIGMFLLKILDSRHVLIGACCGALAGFDARFVRAGESVSDCLSGHRTVRVDHVAHPRFARIEFRFRASRFLRWNSQYRNHGRRGSSNHYWSHRRSLRPAPRNFVLVHNVWRGLERGVLGQTTNHERDHQP